LASKTQHKVKTKHHLPIHIIQRHPGSN